MHGRALLTLVSRSAQSTQDCDIPCSVSFLLLLLVINHYLLVSGPILQMMSTPWLAPNGLPIAVTIMTPQFSWELTHITRRQPRASNVKSSLNSDYKSGSNIGAYTHRVAEINGSLAN
jgi:hypothetical protein